jgi:hypothetical protein
LTALFPWAGYKSLVAQTCRREIPLAGIYAGHETIDLLFRFNPSSTAKRNENEALSSDAFSSRRFLISLSVLVAGNVSGAFCVNRANLLSPVTMVELSAWSSSRYNGHSCTSL